VCIFPAIQHGGVSDLLIMENCARCVYNDMIVYTGEMSKSDRKRFRQRFEVMWQNGLLENCPRGYSKTKDVECDRNVEKEDM